MCRMVRTFSHPDVSPISSFRFSFDLVNPPLSFNQEQGQVACRLHDLCGSPINRHLRFCSKIDISGSQAINQYGDIRFNIRGKSVKFSDQFFPLLREGRLQTLADNSLLPRAGISTESQMVHCSEFTRQPHHLSK